MSLNWLEINEVLNELPLEGAFLQNIRQINYTQLVFELRSPGRNINLLICLDRHSLRLHEISHRPASLPKPPRFAAYLRSRVKGAKVLEARQLGSDRIIRFLLKKGERCDKLYIRLWGGAANIILCDGDDHILDAFSRRPKRNEQSGCTFRPPEESAPPKKEFTLRPRSEDFESYSLFLESLYGREEEDRRTGELKEKIRKELDYEENAILARLGNLEKRLADYENEEEYRKRGDILMASLHLMNKGQKELIPDPSLFGECAAISLDPTLSPADNAQSYYKKAGKAARGREITSEEISNGRARLKGLRQKREEMESCDDPRQLESLLAPGQIHAPKSGGKEELPGLMFASGAFSLIVGRSAKENEALLRRHMRGNDLWLHTRDYPGAYVFIRVPKGKSVPLETLLDAGNLALFYSKAKTAGAADLYYTQVKYLRKAKNGKAGLVLPTREKNLYVKLDETRINRLKGND